MNNNIPEGSNPDEEHNLLIDDVPLDFQQVASDQREKSHKDRLSLTSSYPTPVRDERPEFLLSADIKFHAEDMGAATKLLAEHFEALARHRDDPDEEGPLEELNFIGTLTLEPTDIREDPIIAALNAADLEKRRARGDDV